MNPNDRCARCHHERSCHEQTMFGVMCTGADWHEISTAPACACNDFAEPETERAE